MDRGAWRATVHRVAKSWTQRTRLKRLSAHALWSGVSCFLASLAAGGNAGWCSSGPLGRGDSLLGALRTFLL